MVFFHGQSSVSNPCGRNCQANFQPHVGTRTEQRQSCLCLEDKFLFNDEDEEVVEELERRQKSRADRGNRKAQKEDQDELEKEEKWKKLHMQMTSSRNILSLSFFGAYAGSSLPHAGAVINAFLLRSYGS